MAVSMVAAVSTAKRTCVCRTSNLGRASALPFFCLVPSIFDSSGLKVIVKRKGVVARRGLKDELTSGARKEPGSRETDLGHVSDPPAFPGSSHGTAVCGPACKVVWEESSREASLYPD